MTVVASAARRARYCETVTPPRSWSPRKVLSVIGVATLPALDEARRDLVDAPVQRPRRNARLEEVGDAVIGLVVDEDRAEQRLLGLDVVRRDAVARLGGIDAGDQGVGGGHAALRTGLARPSGQAHDFVRRASGSIPPAPRCRRSPQPYTAIFEAPSILLDRQRRKAPRRAPHQGRPPVQITPPL